MNRRIAACQPELSEQSGAALQQWCAHLAAGCEWLTLAIQYTTSGQQCSMVDSAAMHTASSYTCAQLVIEKNSEPHNGNMRMQPHAARVTHICVCSHQHPWASLDDTCCLALAGASGSSSGSGL
jgi:hypothetical protein